MSSEIVPERLSTKNVFLGKKNTNFYLENYCYFTVFRHVTVRQQGGGARSSVPSPWAVDGVRSSGAEKKIRNEKNI